VYLLTGDGARRLGGVLRAELRNQVLYVLTPEQQAKAKELRLKGEKRLERFATGR
jgi:Spy/CpxP family protein refolding chaperone